jgi:hypothetical protein
MRKLLFESLIFRPLTEPAPAADVAAMTELATAIGDVAGGGGLAAACRYARSMPDPAMDARLEIHALNNAYYDVERFGIRFVASPRHADVLLVTGPVTKNMRAALERTYHATPIPNGSSRLEIAPVMAAVSRAATRWSAVSQSFRSTSTFQAAPYSDRDVAGPVGIARSGGCRRRCARG